MTPSTAALLEANDAAQAAFHEMIVAQVQADANHPLTRAYEASERRMDDVLRDLQWEKAKAELDAAIAADHFQYPTEEALDELVRIGVIEEVPR